MALPKKLDLIDERLQRIEAQLAVFGSTVPGELPAPTKVTQQQLEEIDGIGPATARKILDLLK